MKFAVAYSTPGQGMDPDRLVEFAQHAEACGFEGLYVPEHIALYRGASLGGFELPTTLEYADPLDLLMYVAASTERLLLGTAVLLLPYHHPVTLAKRLATIDVLSKGRMRLLTVGLGSLPGEAHAVGVDYASRGRRTDEAIDVLRLLWSGGPDGVSYSGEFFTFENVASYPHPLAPLPVHIGGSSRAAARRAGLRGDGYFPGGALPPAERAAQWELARTGRDDLEYTRWASTDLTPDAVTSYERQGVTRLVINPQSPADLTTFATRFNLT